MSASTGLIESSKRVAGTLLAILQTRLALLSNELEEERLRIRQMFFYGSVALFFFGLAIMLLTVFIVILFWDSYRLQTLGGLSSLFFILGLLMWHALNRLANESSALFSASLAELSNDRNSLSSP